MEIIQLFDLLEKIEARVNSYWTFWSVTVVAIGGWLFGAKSGFTLGDKKTYFVIAVIIFFMCNLSVLWPATKLAMSLRDEIRIKSIKHSFESTRLQAELKNDFYKLRLNSTLILHLVVDFAVVIMIIKLF